MEERNGIILRHKPTGLYYGKDLEKTHSLWKAWRWKSENDLGVWLDASIYAPPFPEEYEPVAVRLTIEVEASA